MRASCADLHVCEILWQVRIRVAVRYLHPDRRRPVPGACPVAELAIVVVSPCVGVPVAAQGQRVIVSAGADLHVGEIRGQACRLSHFDWRRPVGGRPVAKLAMAVPSPCVNVAVAAQGQRMTPSGADLHVGEILWQVRIHVAVRYLHPDRRRPVAGACPVAELATAVVSPGVGVPVAAQGQRMIVSGADLHVGEILWQVRIRVAVRLPHPDRRSPVAACPVAELAILVAAPCVGVSVAAHSQGKTIGTAATVVC